MSVLGNIQKSNDQFCNIFRWVVLFSHPLDFTPVCTTELGRMAVHMEEFKKRNVKLLALSCDELGSHSNWVNVSKCCTKGAQFAAGGVLPLLRTN